MMRGERQAREREHGQTMVEYAMVLTVITVVTIAAFILIGDTAAGALGDLVDFFS